MRRLDLLLSLFVASIPFPPPVLQIREIQTSNERLCDYELHQRPARRANLTRQVGEGRSASGKKVKERRGGGERERQKERKKERKKGEGERGSVIRGNETERELTERYVEKMERGRQAS